jgi:DNA-binding transcriptional regulator WhiA
LQLASAHDPCCYLAILSLKPIRVISDFLMRLGAMEEKLTLEKLGIKRVSDVVVKLSPVETAPIRSTQRQPK